MARPDTEPTEEERLAVAAVLECLKGLTSEGRHRVIKTVEIFYGKTRPTRGSA